MVKLFFTVAFNFTINPLLLYYTGPTYDIDFLYIIYDNTMCVDTIKRQNAGVLFMFEFLTVEKASETIITIKKSKFKQC